MSDLTDFQILQLAATLAATTDKQVSLKSMVERMFECATLIRIELGDEELAAAYHEKQAQKAINRQKAMEKLSKSFG